MNGSPKPYPNGVAFPQPFANGFVKLLPHVRDKSAAQQSSHGAFERQKSPSFVIPGTIGVMCQRRRDGAFAARMEQDMTMDIRATDAAKGRRGKH